MRKIFKKVTLMGIMITCFGFFLGCSTSIKEQAVSDIIELHTWHFTSGVRNNAIKVQHTDNTIFECTVDKGYLVISNDESGKNVLIESGETIYWTPYDDELATWIDLAYVKIILKNEDNIIGYAIIEIKQNPNSGLNYHAEILKSIVFPKINGQYQFITDEYVNTTMASIIAER